MSVPRGFAGGVLLDDGRFLIAGGDYATTTFATAEVYDPAKGTWSGVGSMTTSHARGMSARLGEGRVVVAGGLTGDLAGSQASPTCSTRAGNTWATQPAAMPGSARSDGAATTLGDGRMLVAGGFPEASSATRRRPSTAPGPRRTRS